LLFWQQVRIKVEMYLARWFSKRHLSRNAAPAKLDAEGRPDFLCVGAQKAGTTWLYHQLNSHPDFWMPPIKELHYFNQMSHSRHPDQAIWRKAPARDERDRFFFAAMDALCSTPFIDRQRYGRLFAPKGELLSGDVTPVYSIVPEEMIIAIMDYFPALKIIFIARDPVERAWSALSMGVRGGGLSPFDVRNPDVVIQHLFHPDILCRSFPSLTVARWRRHVPAEQMRIYFFDDLVTDPARLRTEIIVFLGGDPKKARARADQKIKEDTNKPSLTAEVRNHLGRFFARELRTCAIELGGAAREWPSRYGL
jgi:hypothetical protein